MKHNTAYYWLLHWELHTSGEENRSHFIMKPNVPSAFLRQFHKGNFAKIYMVKWSQSWMYVAMNMNSGVSKNDFFFGHTFS